MKIEKLFTHAHFIFIISTMLKVMSANIRFNTPNDGDNAWPNRKNLLADKIKHLGLDIFGTQEGREPQLRELEALVEHDILDTNRDWIDERMYPCLYQKGVHFINSGDIWLSETPYKAGTKSFDSMFPRLATWGESQSFFICNVHLDHDKEYTREEQARVLCNELKTLNRSNKPFILMGDFNTDPKSNVYDFITSALNLIDPWKTHKLREESSFHLFKGHYAEGYRIDWILHSPEIKSHHIQLLKDEDNGVYLSDHFPVYCELELK